MLEEPLTRELQIANMRGIVTGVPPHLLGIEDETESGDRDEAQYSIEIGGDGYALARRYLEPTGERVDRGALYDGTSIGVDLAGNEVREPRPPGQNQ